MIAILDTDGMRLVAWGVGQTEASARRDAKRQEGYAPTEHERVVTVSAARAHVIRRGDVAADDLVPRAGRPAVAGTKRDVELRVRVTAVERAQVAEKAGGPKLLSAYVRKRLGLK